MRTIKRVPAWPLQLWLSLLVATTACSDSPEVVPIAESPTPAPSGSLQVFVTALSGEPLPHVSFSLEGRVLTTSSPEGAVLLTDLPLGTTLQLTASRPGFSSSTREVVLQAEHPSTLRFSLQPSRDAVLDRAELGGKVLTPDGLQLDFPPSAVVDVTGKPVTGPVQLRYTLLDQPDELPLAPGDFRAQQRDGSAVQLESFGMAEVKLEQNGQPVQLAAPVTLRFPLFQAPSSANSPLYAGQSIGLYSFDETTGRWLEEGTGAVVYLNGKPTFEATVSHFSWWNADMPLEDKNCITGKAIDATGKPLPNLTVEATGEDYTGGSTSTTDQNGLFCVDVKRGSLNTLQLYGGTPAQLYELKTSNLQVEDVATQCTLGECLELGTLTVPVTSDRDQDGVTVLSGDCDDDNSQVNPNASERCNGIDDDCDGELDEDFPTRQTFYADLDGDTFGDPQETTLACVQPQGYTLDAHDCDDTRDYIHPNAAESCNGRDDDCDGNIDEEVMQQTWPDADLDGYGSSTGSGGPREACGIPYGYSSNLQDCDDANASIHLNALEVCDGLDNNCDGSIDEAVTHLLYLDLDDDGYGDSQAEPLQGCAETAQTSLNNLDCDDTNPSISPEADELPDGVDNNCNGGIDETEVLLYPDLDGDGYGSGEGVLLPVNRPGYAVLSGDCDDTHTEISPSAAEVCDGLDNDCDGQADEQLPLVSLYRDADGDGYGDTTQPLSSCGASEGYVFNQDDCDDLVASIHPNTAEACDGIDNDCDGLADEGIPLDRFYVDADGDAYGDVSSPVDACAAPPGTVSNHNDCNDGNAEIHPNSQDLCDGIDNDCDGALDEDVVALYYTDADGDAYGDETLGASCLMTELSVTRGGDCDDANASAYPGAPDVAGDGVDLSCDGSDGLAPSVGLTTSTF
ncbi:MAG: MopE-related protein, partial [Myxococcota bacterium]